MASSTVLPGFDIYHRNNETKLFRCCDILSTLQIERKRIDKAKKCSKWHYMEILIYFSQAFRTNVQLLLCTGDKKLFFAG